MGILSHVLAQDAKLVTATVDKYGDQNPTAETSVKCRFRYITQLDKGTHMEGIGTDNEAIIWFEPDVDIVEGSIVKVDSVYWRVDKLVKARKLTGNTIEFLKAFVNRHEISEEFS
jgi:hypothetical protein